MTTIFDCHIKLAFIGTGGVGKTSWATMIRTGEFRKKYIATIGYELTHLKVKACDQNGMKDVLITIKDISGQQVLGRPSMGNLLNGVQGIAVVGDIGFKGSMNSMSDWREWGTKAGSPTEHAPVTFVVNKVESESDMINFEKFKTRHFSRKFRGSREMAPVYATSVKMEKQYWEPIFYLLRKVLCNDSIEFSELLDASEDVLHYNNSIDN
jgi:GTP-binding nuclear protein Ran